MVWWPPLLVVLLAGLVRGSLAAPSTTDFVCPDEFGYYAHPADCSLYYVCVFGGSLLESCSGGLMYSNELQTCDWPRNVDCPLKSQQRLVTSNVTLSPSETSTTFRTVPIGEKLNEGGATGINPEIPQQRLSRSYSGTNTNYGYYDEVPVGRRVKRQAYYQYPYGGSSGQVYVPQTRTSLSQGQAVTEYLDNNDNYYYDEEDVSTPATSSGHYVDTISLDKSISGKFAPTQRITSQDEYEEALDYISQRYAANISNKVEPQVSKQRVNQQSAQRPTQPPFREITVQQPQRQQLTAEQTVEPSKDYEYYYDYEETPRVPQSSTTSTSTTTPRPQLIRHHITQQPQAPPRRRPGSKPTLLPPSNQILKGASTHVRNIYADPPTRPEPLYDTPEPNTAATKCQRSVCVIPDCNCGGKDIPGGLDNSNTPQLVILTFDDSVNDLNKNLYKDLFEVGRKNPNGCPISATFYVSHEWTDYSQVQNLAADGHEIASHSVSHSFGEQFSAAKWMKEMHGQREILSAYGGVKLNQIRGMRAPFLAIGGNNMFKMLYDSNFTYDSSMPVYENNPPSWPYTLDYKIFHQCMIPPCPTKSFPGVWEVPMVMWQDLKGGRCSMGDACSNPSTAQGVYEMLVKNFERHYTTNRAPFGLYYHAAWFTQAHHKEGFESFLDVLVSMEDVWLVTNWQALQWLRNPVGINDGLHKFPPFDCRNAEYIANLPKRCSSSRVCNLWHKSGVRYMKTCQNCPESYPWTGATGV